LTCAGVYVRREKPLAKGSLPPANPCVLSLADPSAVTVPSPIKSSIPSSSTKGLSMMDFHNP